MHRTIAAAILLITAALPLASGAFQPTKGAESPDGRAVVRTDLAPDYRKANISSKGLGCCVFRSGDHAAHYQNIPALYGWPEWMVAHGIPGGGWPDKVDDLIPRIAKDRGLPVPTYVQHTGGNPEFLELALKTGRMVCVNYNGRDDFYRGPIAHVVNLVYLDDKRAAILDNNRIGVYVWMTRDEFLSRWRGPSGGWAYVLLGSPCPPALLPSPPPLQLAKGPSP
jgi:hypothetical protein